MTSGSSWLQLLHLVRQYVHVRVSLRRRWWFWLDSGYSLTSVYRGFWGISCCVKVDSDLACRCATTGARGPSFFPSCRARCRLLWYGWFLLVPMHLALCWLSPLCSLDCRYFCFTHFCVTSHPEVDSVLFGLPDHWSVDFPPSPSLTLSPSPPPPPKVQTGCTHFWVIFSRTSAPCANAQKSWLSLSSSTTSLRRQRTSILAEPGPQRSDRTVCRSAGDGLPTPGQPLLPHGQGSGRHEEG